MDFGTSEEDAIGKLAATVGVVGTNGEEGQASIAWTIADYNANEAGDYTATGKLTLPEGWTGAPSDVTAMVTVKEDPAVAAKAAFLGALAEKAEVIDVAEVAIEEEDISVTFHWGADVQEVYEAAEELLAAFQTELEDATLVLDGEAEFGLHDDGVAVDIARYLLDEVGVNEFLKGKHTVTAGYIATATDKAGVEFTLAGELSFQMAAPSADDVAAAKDAFLTALEDKVAAHRCGRSGD
ncbi:MAG: hypothetical protein ACOX3O_01375 [bacterium]